eukprot:1773282-Rhodomonas_salina.4
MKRYAATGTSTGAPRRYRQTVRAFRAQVASETTEDLSVKGSYSGSSSAMRPDSEACARLDSLNAGVAYGARETANGHGGQKRTRDSAREEAVLSSGHGIAREKTRRERAV